LTRKNVSPGYIPDHINNPKQLTSYKKKQLETTILYFLKTPREKKDLEDFLGVSPKLIQRLINELLAEEKIIKIQLKSKIYFQCKKGK